MWSTRPGGSSSEVFVAREQYRFEGDRDSRDEWGPLSGPSLPQVPSADYYRYPRASTDDFAVPEGFSDDVVAVGRLTVDQRRRFEAAGQWRAAASRLQDTHAGSWYIALVAAIEALTDEPDVPDPCPSCGHDRSQRPTASFKDFLERYAAGPGRRSQMDQLYRVRSSLVHGRELVDVSWRLLGLDFSPRTMRTTSHSFQLETLVSLAIVNWLRDVAPAA